MFNIKDRDELLRLFKVVNATQYDIDSIFLLYKKYVNPKQQSYSTSCNCRNSISSLYEELRDWYSKEGWQFPS